MPDPTATDVIEPVFASGRIHDATVRIYFIEREPGESRKDFEKKRQASVTPPFDSSSSL